MGGKAIKNARRMTPEQHQEAFLVMSGILKSQFPDLVFGKLTDFGSKPDFGNMSLVVVRSTPDTEEQVRSYLKHWVPTDGVFENGDFLAIGLNGVQMDMTFVDLDDATLFCQYHAYNGLGALIGKVAHAMGLTLRANGLFYRLMDGTVLVEDILVTNEWSKILTLLGYHYPRWTEGFEALEDIFVFVASSPNFRPELFHKEVPSDSEERPTVAQLFSQWLQAEPESPFRNPALSLLFQQVRGFEERHEKALSDYAQAKQRRLAAREQFTGHLVTEWTGRTGRELGALMRYIEETFGGKTGVQDWVLASSAEHIQETVMTLHTQLG
jgi:hypothetical protein